MRPRSRRAWLCERGLRLELGRRRRRSRRSELPWPAVRIDVGQEEEVRVRLRAVAKGPRANVPEPERHASEEEADEPPEERDEEENGIQGAADQEGGQCEEDAEERLQPVLALGPVDPDLDGIRARRADEAREGVGDQEDVRVDLDDVLHVGGDEAV